MTVTIDPSRYAARVSCADTKTWRALASLEDDTREKRLRRAANEVDQQFRANAKVRSEC